MSPVPVTSFGELSPELLPVIIGLIPLVCRLSTLLSLALTCHRLHDIIFPRLMYDNVRLIGEDQALSTLNALIAKAELVTEEHIQEHGNPSPSHCIHHLCLDSSITPIHTPGHSLSALQKLINIDGLRHLSALTLQVIGKWDRTEGNNSTDHFLKLPTSFVTSLKTKCPKLKTIRLSWIEPETFLIESLTSIRIVGYLFIYPRPTICLSQLPPNLHTLELRLRDDGKAIDACSPGGLLSCVIPSLRTLILDKFSASNPTSTVTFWRAHPGIERLELWRGLAGRWFNDFGPGMLPNLKYLQCNVDHALVLLPHVSMVLIRLGLWETYNAQGPYLLRSVAQGGILPALRSLGIDRKSGNSMGIQRKSTNNNTLPLEGHRWREDENGEVSEANKTKPTRQFDGNYVMSLSRAAPNLEELELMGTSDDTLDSITTSLSRFPKLRRLTLSSGINYAYRPFFARSENWKEYSEFSTGDVDETYFGKYAPETFDEAARDLADGCRTLDIVTMGNIFGELLIKDGLSMRIVRECDGGAAKELKRIRAWGNIVGKDEEW